MSKNILLTGSTGFLGFYLAKRFLQDEDTKLFLLARHSENLTARQRVERLFQERCSEKEYNSIKDRLEIIEGGITYPNLGLDQKQRERLSKEVVTIFHSAALAQFNAPYETIKDVVTGLPGKVLFFIDTCHAGNVMGTKRRGSADIIAVVNDLSAAENGVVVFASSTGRQYSLENPKWGNGAFTKAVVEGLSGKADYTSDGNVTINEMDLYISERVKTLTDGAQTPTTSKPDTVPDFPLAAW